MRWPWPAFVCSARGKNMHWNRKLAWIFTVAANCLFTWAFMDQDGTYVSSVVITDVQDTFWVNFCKRKSSYGNSYCVMLQDGYYLQVMSVCVYIAQFEASYFADSISTVVFCRSVINNFQIWKRVNIHWNKTNKYICRTELIFCFRTDSYMVRLFFKRSQYQAVEESRNM